MLVGVLIGVLSALAVGALAFYGRHIATMLRHLADTVRDGELREPDRDLMTSATILGITFGTAMMFAIGVGAHSVLNWASRAAFDAHLDDPESPYPFDSLYQIEWPWWTIGAGAAALLILVAVLAVFVPLGVSYWLISRRSQ